MEQWAKMGWIMFKKLFQWFVDDCKDEVILDQLMLIWKVQLSLTLPVPIPDEEKKLS